MNWRVADDHRVAGVGAALVADHQVGPLGEHVDELALPLVAPLGAHDHHAGGLRRRTCRLPADSTKRAPRGAPESSGKPMRGRAKSQFAARARPTRIRGLEREARPAVSRGVWISPERAPGEPADRDARARPRARTAGCRRGCRSAAAGAGAQARRRAGAELPARERGAARVVAHDGELTLLVDRVEVDDHRLAQRAGVLGDEYAGADQPELLGTGDAGCRWRHRRALPPRRAPPPRRSRCLAPRRRAAEPSAARQRTREHRDRGPHAASGTGTLPPSRASASAASATTAMPMTHTATSRPAMRLNLRLGVEVGHDPAAHRYAAARGDQVGVLARRAAKREPAEADPDGQHGEQQQPPGEHQAARPSRAPVRR